VSLLQARKEAIGLSQWSKKDFWEAKFQTMLLVWIGHTRGYTAKLTAQMIGNAYNKYIG
jgi:hypothetical protein